MGGEFNKLLWHFLICYDKIMQEWIILDYPVYKCSVIVIDLLDKHSVIPLTGDCIYDGLFIVARVLSEIQMII